MNYRTQGVVIKRQDIGEADRILTIFTERFGKIKAIARGVRKIKAKLAGSLEPFMLVELSLYDGRTFYTVTGAEIEEEYPTLHTDLHRIANAFYLGEVIDRFEKEDQKSTKVFELLIRALRAINETSDSLMLRVFDVGMLKMAGFWPDIYECVHCKNKLKDEENYWDANEGGIICSNCQGHFHHGRLISNDLIKVFRLIEKEDFNLAERLKVPENLQIEIEDTLSSYLRGVLETDLRSERFVKETNQ